MVVKQRLDMLLMERQLAGTIESARAFIGAGRVEVDGKKADKVGTVYPTDCSIEIREKQPYVSRGGEKIAAGLQFFGIDPGGMICADIGCSTGGFTDCLLQHGARKVYSVDVGYGVLDWQLRQDDRVVALERTNARYLTREQIPDAIDLAVIDASFISLGLLFAPVKGLFEGTVAILALVKPQFELPREKVARGGVVRERALHEEALDLARKYGEEAGLVSRGVVMSPLKGAKGNTEFLMYLVSPA